MINRKKIGLAIPAYNEEGLITRTLKSVPKYVDLVVCINDASKDKTQSEIKKFVLKESRIKLINNQNNSGVGFSVKRGLEFLLEKNMDYVVIAAGDNQCDLSKIKDFVTQCQTLGFDVCRGNRFKNKKELKNMPTIRRAGNSIYSFVTKFVSGYYSLFDFQSSYGAIKTEKLREIELNSLRNDYLFDNSLWINLNIVDAKVKEIPIPIIYGEEVSDVNYVKFVTKSAFFLVSAFFNRIYQKYLLILHPVGVFLITGLLMLTVGIAVGVYIIVNSIGPKTPSTATVMLSVIPFFLGFQLLLNAIIFDIQNEPK
jgi:glycosyltransferase involved in cell wall biosynthesis